MLVQNVKKERKKNDCMESRWDNRRQINDGMDRIQYECANRFVYLVAIVFFCARSSTSPLHYGSCFTQPRRLQISHICIRPQSIRGYRLTNQRVSSCSLNPASSLTHSNWPKRGLFFHSSLSCPERILSAVCCPFSWFIDEQIAFFSLAFDNPMHTRAIQLPAHDVILNGNHILWI